jgi:hypothetical protein
VALTNRQIERYSRQLIVPDFGGIAQERLLAAHILLIADDPDVDFVLAYLVGAGVGQIDLLSSVRDPAASAAIIARMRDLNPDSTVRVAHDPVVQDRVANDREDQNEFDRRGCSEFGKLDLVLVLASDNATLDQTRALCDRRTNVASDFGIIFARLDVPPRIAVFPRRPPCPLCAGAGDLLGPVAAQAANAGFVASLAALEAIKMLARFGAGAQPILIEFHGYESSAGVIDSIPGSTCACAAARSEQKP